MKLRIFTLLMTVVACSTIIHAETISGTCGDNLTWTLSTEDSVLTISGTGAMNDFNYAPWYSLRSFISSIIIQDGVTSIGNVAFNSCDRLSQVSMPNSITKIGYSSFSQCQVLNSIKLSDNLVSIGSYAFYSCTSLTDIKLPNKLKDIGDAAFDGCYALTQITIPNSVEHIGIYAFDQCGLYINNNWNENNGFYIDDCLIKANIENTGQYAIKEGTRLIADNAAQNASMSSILFPNTISFIGVNAFHSCTHLKSVIIPKNVKVLGNGAFYRCTSLEKVIVSEGVEAIGKSSFGDCFNLSIVQLPASLKIIGSSAFSIMGGLSQLKEIIIPNNVTSIGDYAFNNCRNLINVIIGENVKEIGTCAFDKCRNLTNIKLSSGLISIGSYAFRNNENLQDITLSDSLEYIGIGAFYNCHELENINIPGGVTEIGNNAFALCNKLKKIVVNNPAPPEIGDNTFYEVPLEVPVYVPDETAVKAYKAHKIWREMNIIAMSNTPTEKPTYYIKSIEDIVCPGFQFVSRKNIIWTVNDLFVPFSDTVKFMLDENTPADSVYQYYYQINQKPTKVPVTNIPTASCGGSVDFAVANAEILAAYPATANLADVINITWEVKDDSGNYAPLSDSDIFPASQKTIIVRYVAVTECGDIIEGDDMVIEVKGDCGVVSVVDHLSEQTNQPAKIIYDGHIYILMPDGRMFTLTGIQAE